MTVLKHELLKHKEIHKGRYWVKTCDTLINTNPRFKDITRDKIKNRYKYLKKLKNKNK